MAKIEDVAAYILHESGPMTAMKLQKLCYYSHAWNLVWDERPLFTSSIQAWANGPVVVDLYRMHRGRFQLRAGDIDGDPARLRDDERGTIDVVIGFYGAMTAHELSELTHKEAPWRLARRDAGLSEFARGTAPITDEAMFEYYDGLTHAAD